MGYFFRFFVADAKPLDFVVVQSALQEIDSHYTVIVDSLTDTAQLFYESEYLALVEINGADDEIFHDDLNEFYDLIGHDDGEAEVRVRKVLANAQKIVAVEAQWSGEDAEPVLSRIDPLWDWLFMHHDGLLQADGEGFYDSSGLILKRHFTL